MAAYVAEGDEAESQPLVVRAEASATAEPADGDGGYKLLKGHIGGSATRMESLQNLEMAPD